MTAVRPGSSGTIASLAGSVEEVRFADAGNVVAAVVPAAQLYTAVHHLTGAGARLADLFAAGEDPAGLHLVGARRRTPIPGGPDRGPRRRIPAIVDLAPSAFYEECEIYEQFGNRLATGKPLNRVALPPHAGPDFPRLGHRPQQEPAGARAARSAAMRSSFPSGRSARSARSRCITGWSPVARKSLTVSVHLA